MTSIWPLDSYANQTFRRKRRNPNDLQWEEKSSKGLKKERQEVPNQQETKLLTEQGAHSNATRAEGPENSADRRGSLPGKTPLLSTKKGRPSPRQKRMCNRGPRVCESNVKIKMVDELEGVGEPSASIN